MTLVKLQWATPNIDEQIAYQARVSNPENQDNPAIAGLLNYCMREGHVSPFEMANVCLEINTTRDIGRQILRHRSFSFQEFSRCELLKNQAKTELRFRTHFWYFHWLNHNAVNYCLLKPNLL